MVWATFALMPTVGLRGASSLSTDCNQKVVVWVFFFFSFQPLENTSDLQVVNNRKLQKGKKHATSVLESRQKRIPCSARHADFGLRFCLCHAQLQVRLANTSSTITYGKEHFKAMAAHTLIKPSLQTGDAEAAPARAEQAVSRVRSVCLAAGFFASLWKCTRTHSSSVQL